MLLQLFKTQENTLRGEGGGGGLSHSLQCTKCLASLTNQNAIIHCNYEILEIKSI